jgi:Ca-activated chloride channel family protein
MTEIEIKQQISAYFDGELSADEAVKVADLIGTDPVYKKYADEIKKLSSALHYWKDEPLSPDLEIKIKTKTQGGRTMKTSTKEYLRVGSMISVFFIVILLSIQVSSVYVKRGIQGRLKAATDDIGDQFSQSNEALFQVSQTLQIASAPVESKIRARTSGVRKAKSDAFLGSVQYEPYYLDTDYSVIKEEVGAEKAFWTAPTMPGDKFNTEEYGRIYENAFKEVSQEALSTFSIDVDTASYSNIRRFLNNGQIPPEDSVRIEEMINYFSYDYPSPENDQPFSITTKASAAPWNKEHKLVMVGLKGKTLQAEKLPPSNLVFLIDVSGSMDDPNKLPLLKQAFGAMVNQLSDKEKVAIVVYAGAAGKVLDATSGANKSTILNAINNLQAGGSTAGAQGIELAYQIAKENFIPGGNNRVILATDGDFNVGVSSTGELTRIIEDKRKEGIYLTVLGFGMGNYKDNRMEQIADKGNGNYYYIDTFNEAKKVLCQELGSTLFTIAKDVKIQVEFNPETVKAYRLVGYENRILNKEDFNDDTKDAGEIGAGHTVTAFYEIIPAGSNEQLPGVDPLKYQKTEVIKNTDELLTVKLRYKEPQEDTSRLLQKIVRVNDVEDTLSGDFQFAAAVAEFGLILRNSQFKAQASYDEVIKAATASKGEDKFAHRAEFISLVEKARSLDTRNTSGSIQFK